MADRGTAGLMAGPVMRLLAGLVMGHLVGFVMGLLAGRTAEPPPDRAMWRR
jgi:hypothetical protein